MATEKRRGRNTVLWRLPAIILKDEEGEGSHTEYSQELGVRDLNDFELGYWTLPNSPLREEVWLEPARGNQPPRKAKADPWLCAKGTESGHL